jgi:hypothetical protein
MIRLAPLLLLLTLPAVAVAAEDIRCRVPSGTVVITDEPALVPPDCKKEPPPPSAGTLSIVPATPPDTAATEQYLQRASEQSEERRLRLAQMAQEAQALAADYRQALADIRSASYTEETLEIGRRIERLKARRTEILGALPRLNPSPEEAATVEGPLATIPP